MPLFYAVHFVVFQNLSWGISGFSSALKIDGHGFEKILNLGRGGELFEKLSFPGTQFEIKSLHVYIIAQALDKCLLAC